MATFKAQIRKEQVKNDKKTNIKIRVSHQRKTRYLKTDLNVEPGMFENLSGMVKSKHPNAAYLNGKLRNKMNEYEKQILVLGDQVDRMDINTIVKLLESSSNGELDFF